MENEKNKLNGGFVTGFLLALLIVWMIWGIGKGGKYEGQTAEEWFNDYDSCDAQLIDYQSCVESAVPDIGYYCSP